MKLRALLCLVFVLSLATGHPRKRHKKEYEKKQIDVRHHPVQKPHKQRPRKHEGVKAKEVEKSGHHVYKKFAMLTAPTRFALEDSSVGQGQPGIQQLLVPVNSASLTQTTANVPAEMTSSFVPAAPSQRIALGTQVAGEQSNTQQVATQVVQPQQPQAIQYQSTPTSSNGDNLVLKATNAASATLQVPEASQTELVGNPAGQLDAGAEGIQTFAAQDSGKETDEMKDLEVYNGPSPDDGQTKPQVEGISPQEDIKVVNLGDDEKTASLTQDKECGGCLPGAKFTNGQCLMNEDAKTAELTGKGTASNLSILGDIQNVEAQEITSLLNDVSKADTPPTAVPESRTGSPTKIERGSQEQDQVQNQITTKGTPRPKIPQTAPLTAPASTHVAQQSTTSAQVAQKPVQVEQPHFNGEQLKELRDFARMYKMYQFIRRMEERLSDPDCAPVCRKICKKFCPEKCCRNQQQVNTNDVSRLMQTGQKINGTGNRPGKLHATGMEDNKSRSEDSEEQEEKKMDKETGKTHILIRIHKNDEYNKPHANISAGKSSP